MCPGGRKIARIWADRWGRSPSPRVRPSGNPEPRHPYSCADHDGTAIVTYCVTPSGHTASRRCPLRRLALWAIRPPGTSGRPYTSSRQQRNRTARGIHTSGRRLPCPGGVDSPVTSHQYLSVYSMASLLSPQPKLSGGSEQGTLIKYNRSVAGRECMPKPRE